MKKLTLSSFLVLAFLIVLPIAAEAQAQKVDMLTRYQITREGSYVGFKANYIFFPIIRGSIGNYQATIFYDPAKIENTSATIRFVTNTFSTNNETRDETLHSESFLDVEKYPEIWFQSTSASASKDGIKLTGNLIIKDISKEATIEIKKPFQAPKQPGAMNQMVAEGKLVFNRMDYEIGKGEGGPWNSIGPHGKSMLSNEMEIDFVFFCTGYNPGHLTARFAQKNKDGSENAVGSVYNDIVQNGLSSGKKLIGKMDKADKGPMFFADLGWILMLNGRAKDAIQAYELGLKVDSNHTANKLRLGDAYVLAGQFDKAIKQYEKEMPNYPKQTHMPEMLKLLRGDLMTKSSISKK